MNAMENASKNASEILSALKTQYNKARQARITIELVEIISGASCVWDQAIAVTVGQTCAAFQSAI